MEMKRKDSDVESYSYSIFFFGPGFDSIFKDGNRVFCFLHRELYNYPGILLNYTKHDGIGVDLNIWNISH